MKKLIVINIAIILSLMVLSLIKTQDLEKYFGLISLLLLAIIIFTLLMAFESRPSGSKDIATIAILGAFSAASRIPFAGIPSFQPSTFIIIAVGAVMGPYAGFMVGIETALISNFFLGQGPWTPWQMLAWGLAGVFGSFLKRWIGKKNGIYALMVLGAVYGYIYGLIMNIWYWLAFIYPHTIESFLLVWSLSVYFDTLHSIGNVLFSDVFGIQLLKILIRFKVRFGVFNPQPLSTLKQSCKE